MGQLNRKKGIGRESIASSFGKGIETGALVGGAFYVGTRVWKHHHAIALAHQANRRRRHRLM